VPKEEDVLGDLPLMEKMLLHMEIFQAKRLKEVARENAKTKMTSLRLRQGSASMQRRGLLLQ
jgi:hypothetical protein